MLKAAILLASLCGASGVSLMLLGLSFAFGSSVPDWPAAPELWNAPGAERPAVDESVDRYSAAEMLTAFNRYRARHGKRPVELHPTLQAVAEHRSSWYRSGHVGLAGDMRRFGWHRSYGENIAHGQRSVSEVMNTWHNSAGHRRNMLGNWRYAGLARNGNIWVQVFGN